MINATGKGINGERGSRFALLHYYRAQDVSRDCPRAVRIPNEGIVHEPCNPGGIKPPGIFCGGKLKNSQSREGNLTIENINK
jgi:hypothetical protein